MKTQKCPHCGEETIVIKLRDGGEVVCEANSVMMATEKGYRGKGYIEHDQLCKFWRSRKEGESK